MPRPGWIGRPSAPSPGLGIHRLHVVGQDDDRRLQTGLGRPERGVDDGVQLIGAHDRLHVTGDIREDPLEVAFLLR